MDRILNAPTPQVSGQVYYVGDEPIDLLDWVNEFSLTQRGKPVRVVPAVLLRVLARSGDVLKRMGIGFPITSSRYRSMTTSNEISMRRTIETFGMPPFSLRDGVVQTVDWLRQYHPSLVSVPAT
jgi:hypothetical protein